MFLLRLYKKKLLLIVNSLNLKLLQKLKNLLLKWLNKQLKIWIMGMNKKEKNLVRKIPFKMKFLWIPHVKKSLNVNSRPTKTFTIHFINNKLQKLNFIPKPKTRSKCLLQVRKLSTLTGLWTKNLQRGRKKRRPSSDLWNLIKFLWMKATRFQWRDRYRSKGLMKSRKYPWGSLFLFLTSITQWSAQLLLLRNRKECLLSMHWIQLTK